MFLWRYVFPFLCKTSLNMWGLRLKLPFNLWHLVCIWLRIAKWLPNTASWCKVKKTCFCKKNCVFKLFCKKNAENDYFDQRLTWAAPKCWSKYTTTVHTAIVMRSSCYGHSHALPFFIIRFNVNSNWFAFKISHFIGQLNVMH